MTEADCFPLQLLRKNVQCAIIIVFCTRNRTRQVNIVSKQTVFLTIDNSQ
jgi:hypothetical protein